MTFQSNNNNLEAKLQSVAATYRQKRDEAHRNQQLALERLRLIRDESDALTATVNDMRVKLVNLQNQAGGSSESKLQLQTLHGEVNQLTKEVGFQHQELIMKREKLKEMMDRKSKECNKFDAVRSTIQKTIQERRAQVSKEQRKQEELVDDISKSQLTRNSKANALKDEVSNDRDGRLLNKWPQIVQAAADQIETKSEEHIFRANIMLDRVVVGYEKQQVQGIQTTSSGNPSREIVEDNQTDTGVTDMTASTATAPNQNSSQYLACPTEAATPSPSHRVSTGEEKIEHRQDLQPEMVSNHGCDNDSSDRKEQSDVPISVLATVGETTTKMDIDESAPDMEGMGITDYTSQ